MPRRITVDENGLVVAVESVPERADSPAQKGNSSGSAGAKKNKGPTPKFEWNQSTRSTVAMDFSAAGLARRRARKKGSWTKKSTQRAKKPARTQGQAKELRAVEQLTNFEEAYVLGVNSSKGSSPNYPLAIAAFEKAYRLDPRRKVKPGAKPATGLFEVPTRLAAAYRMNKQPYRAQMMYEWVLERHDSRFARVGLAAVREDNGQHLRALKLYQSVLDRYPADAYALRGVARTLGNLGRGEEARKTHEKARRIAEGKAT